MSAVAVAARSDDAMLVRPTRSRVEPGCADGLPACHGIDRSSDPSPLVHVVAVATLAAVMTLASVATLAAVAAALCCRCGFTLPSLLLDEAILAAVAAALGCSCGCAWLQCPVTVDGSQWEEKRQRHRQRQRQRQRQKRYG